MEHLGGLKACLALLPFRLQVRFVISCLSVAPRPLLFSHLLPLHAFAAVFMYLAKRKKRAIVHGGLANGDGVCMAGAVTLRFASPHPRLACPAKISLAA
jgi:hypothetical protein